MSDVLHYAPALTCDLYFKGLFTDTSGDLTDHRQDAIGLCVSAGGRHRVCRRGRQEGQRWDRDWNRPRDDLLLVRMSLGLYTGVI